MYNKHQPWSFYFLIIVIIVIIIYFFVFVYLITKIQDKPIQHNLKIIDIPVIGVKHKEVVRNIFNRFKNIFILNGLYRYPKTSNKRTNEKHLDFEDGASVNLPFLSPNITDVTIEDKIPVAGFKSIINYNGDFTFINDRISDVCWNSNTDFIKQRTLENTFLVDDESNNQNQTHYIYLNVIRYIFKGNNAVHINYIVRKKGMGDKNVIAFIKFLNWFQQFVTKNNLFYFSISGNNNIRSAKWRKIVKKILKDSCYISPGIESHFITDNDNKYGARTSRFIIVSKPMAPNGVYFYLSQQVVDNLSPSNILIAEILQKDKYKSVDDETQVIFNNISKERHINPSMRIDLETTNDVNLEQFNLHNMGIFKPVTKHTKDSGD